MPSPVRRKSYGSVEVFWIDRAEIEKLLQDLVNAFRRFPEVLAVVLFGSLTKGTFTVGSDVDLLLLLEASAEPFPNRIPRYLPSRIPMDVEIFPYTLEELQQRPPLVTEALRTGRILWVRPAHEERIRALLKTLRGGEKRSC